MKKTISVIICTLLCLLSLSGCGSVKELDIDTASTQLMSAGIFDEDLTEVSNSVTEKRLALDAKNIEVCRSYAGTKAVVDEIVMIKAVSDEAAENVKASFDKHIQSQKNSYASYRPDEVPKLEDAVVMTSGSYAVMVVSKDASQAEKIVKDCFK